MILGRNVPDYFRKTVIYKVAARMCKRESIAESVLFSAKSNNAPGTAIKQVETNPIKS